MHRGDLKFRLNIERGDPVNMACFVLIMNPKEANEVEDKIKELLFDLARPYHNSISSIEGEIRFDFGLVYQIHYSSDSILMPN